MRAVSAPARTTTQSACTRDSGGNDTSECVEHDGGRPETVHLG